MSEKTHGGKRAGAGAKRKADVEKSNEIFLKMIKDVKGVDTDEDAKLALAKELLTFERGVMFISEHIFGKPEQTIKQDLTLNDFSIKEALKFKE